MASVLTRRRLLLAKIESTYASDSSPTGTNAILVRNLDIQPLVADTVNRDLVRPYMGQADQLLAQTRVEVTFEVELAGSGTAGTAPAYGPLLRSCGLEETLVTDTSATYAPESSGFESSTLYYHQDGIRHKVTGCRGSFEISGEVGGIPVISFSMTGIYNAPTDETLPTPTYSNQATPLLFKQGNTSSFSVFGFSGVMQSYNFNIANSVVFRELVGGSQEILITDRAPSGTVVIEAPTITDKDFFTVATGTSTGSITFQHGSTAGNIVTMTTAQSDLGNLTYSDSDGIQMLNMPFIAVPTNSGNDELSLVFT
jgi:hypothetical protein